MSRVRRQRWADIAMRLVGGLIAREQERGAVSPTVEHARQAIAERSCACGHSHGGRAYGICLAPGCECVAVTVGEIATAPASYPPQFASYAVWQRWCAQDREDECGELLQVELASMLDAAAFEAKFEVDPVEVVPQRRAA